LIRLNSRGKGHAAALFLFIVAVTMLVLQDAEIQARYAG